ncbi:hypothetical protein WDU94_013276 [Cyamophila willieti]
MAEPSLAPTIQKMLFGLGDCKKPLEATSYIIEEYLRQQLDYIVYQAQACGGQGCEEITVKNILFLLRNNSVRLQRVYHYFDMKSKQQEITGSIIGGTATSDKDIEADLKSFFNGNKKSRNLNVKQQILEFIDEFKIKIDSEFFDEAKHERLVRQNELSIEQSKEDYLAFEQSRTVSFDVSWRQKTTKNKREFNEWLQIKLKNNPGVSLLTTTAYELLQYLSKEIVAQIVDCVLQLRADAKVQTISSSDFTSSANNLGPKPEMFSIMPDEVHEVMRRCQYLHNKPFHNVSYCILF